MSFGSLSALGKAEALLRTTNLNTTRFSRLCSLFGIASCSESALGRALRGGAGLPPQADAELRALLVRIEALIEQAKPFALSFNDPEAIHEILCRIESGDLWWRVIDTQEPVTTNG